MQLSIPSVEDFTASGPKIDQRCYLAATKLIAAFDEKREITRFGRRPDYPHLSECRGAVLVFLPGLREIEQMNKAMVEFEQNAPADRKNYWHILPLHSRITSEEQSRVFQELPEQCKHYRKVILSTNIAESSLTVPDIIYVVDFCLVKQLVTDQKTNFCTLQVCLFESSVF